MDDIHEDGEASAVTLSEETIKKFKELNAQVEAIEDAEDEAIEDEVVQEEPQKKRDPRKADEGIDTETGEVLVEEEQEEEKPEEEVTEEPEGEVPEKETTADEEVQEISLPARLVHAGHRNGLSDDDILALGERAETVLSKMADNTDLVSEQLGEQGRFAKERAEPEPSPKFSYDQPAEEGLEDGRFDKTAAAINDLQSKFAKLEALETKRQADFVDSTVDGFLDGKTKEFPELGDSKTLTEGQVGVRKRIYDTADNIRIGSATKGRPLSLNSALEQAFSIYEGQNVKQVVRSKLVKDVKQREKQLTIRPSHRRTQDVFKTPQDRAKAKVAEWNKKHGIVVSEDDEF